MRVNEKLLKPLTETKYLTTENADRYRSIIRIFYLEYEKLNYWMYQEDVFEELKKDPKITSHMAKEEDLSPKDYITYTSTSDKNISYYDSTLKKIYTLKNNQNKNH